MDIFIQFLLLVLGFFLLVKGADFFVDGAAGIAEKFKIPQIIIGLTVVAFGTSAPEAAISISAALKGTADISIGNVIGSNILNILLILGITSCIIPLKIQKSTFKYEIPFVITISVVLVIMGLFGHINLICGLILWALFICFIIYLFKYDRESIEEDREKKEKNIWLVILATIVGLAAVVFGSNITVNSATELAKIFGVDDRFIALTIVAFGTSLPELITSITAAVKKQDDIAIGNIVGSNIFNILFVLGTSSLITTIPFQQKFIIDGIFATLAACILWLLVAKNKKLSRFGGIIMLIMYLGYFVYLCI